MAEMEPAITAKGHSQAMVSLSWRQVNAWRLSQHCLAPRLERQDFVQAARRTGGIQAQVMSAAELALGARAQGLTPQDVQSALWQERTLIKTWAMRATLHLLTASDYPLYVAARSLSDTRPWIRYFEDNGVPKAKYEVYLAAAPEILGDEAMTREQLATALARHTHTPELRSLMISKGWGTPLKPLAWGGTLCFGPNNGRNVTFVNARRWIGEWQAVEPYEALKEVARRYLRAFGAAKVEEFALWWAIGLIRARKLFQSMEDELETVEVEGWRAVALRECLEPVQNAELTGSVHLLPLFDAYVMGIGRGADIEPILPKAYQRLVYRPQGWVTAVVLEDGYMRGVWEYKNQRAQVQLRVRMFAPPSPGLSRGIEAEAERLSAYWNSKVILEYVD